VLVRVCAMNVLILHGSPRRNGSSDTLVKHFVRGLNAGQRPQVTEFYANDVHVRPCQGCLTCATRGNNTCAIEDDMQQIYSAFVAADLVVWATPMYWGYMTAQLKTILDRMEALACGPAAHWKGKTFIVIITYHHHYQSTVAFFERVTPFFGVRLHTLVYHSLSQDGRGDVHASNCQEKLDEAFTLGKRLALGCLRPQ
jgi:multimeric flavodoxin WrbA